MRRLASAALLSTVLLLTACSALGNEGAEPADSLEPAPPIKAMNEVVPVLDGGEVGQIAFDQSYLIELLCPGVEPAKCKPPREQVESLERQLTEEHEAMKPAEGAEKRAIANLPVRGAEATLTAWRARNNRLCTNIEYRYPDSTVFGAGDGYGPFGPCEARTTCSQICLAMARGPTGEPAAVVAGTVATSGDQLRISFLDGKRARYPLRGPVVPQFPDHRVFMLDLWKRLYERLEVLVDDEVTASVDVPQKEIEAVLCQRRFAVPSRELQACLREAARKGETNG